MAEIRKWSSTTHIYVITDISLCTALIPESPNGRLTQMTQIRRRHSVPVWDLLLSSSHSLLYIGGLGHGVLLRYLQWGIDGRERFWAFGGMFAVSTFSANGQSISERRRWMKDGLRYDGEMSGLGNRVELRLIDMTWCRDLRYSKFLSSLDCCFSWHPSGLVEWPCRLWSPIRKRLTLWYLCRVKLSVSNAK
jgi:hypothetical protein